MPSTYTTNSGLEKVATGEQSGTWGDTNNTNWDLVDTSLNGILSITLAAAGTSGSPNTLDITDGTADEGLNKYITFTDGGDLGADVFVQLTPNDAEKVCYIYNNLSGSQDLYLFQGTYNASRDLVIAAGDIAVVAFSGGGASASTATSIMLSFDRTAPGAIGGTTPAAGTFTTLIGTTIDGSIGSVTPAAGVFTAFTSNGIDDNATGERLQLADTLLTIGSATATSGYTVIRAVNDGSFSIFGGNAADTGGGVDFYGGGHATLANDINFKGGATTQLYYDDSASSWDFKANLITTTGALTCGALTSTGIDDNATGERLQLTDTVTSIGVTAAGSHTCVILANSAGSSRLDLGSEADGGKAGFRYDHSTDTLSIRASAATQLEWDSSGWDFQANQIILDSTVSIKERAASLGDVAGHGQLWVKNTTPCQLWYTDDAGTDTQIV